MPQTNNPPNQAGQHLLDQVRAQVLAEHQAQADALRQRSDYIPALDYFLDLLARPLSLEKMRAAIGRPVMEQLCNLAPYELFHAFGVHPVRMGCGCNSVQRLVASGNPVLMCPVMKSNLGMQRLHGQAGEEGAVRVVPTSCDWVVKYPEMARQDGRETHFLELPHSRQSEKGQQRWLEEIYGFAALLEKKTGKKLKRQRLLASIEAFMRAWRALQELADLRRRRLIPGIFFMVVANSFMLDAVEPWTEHLGQLLEEAASRRAAATGRGIFLAGSPIAFPNYKLPHLIEEAGMDVCADDLCTSERVLPGAVCYDDPSEHGLLRALSERYHRGCICPTFADNERRVNSILNTCRQNDIQGVVYHVLKGCHPCDIESVTMGETLKQHGYKFLRIETDFAKEDSQNLLTRLEAFGEIL
ncbi:MAG: 2-hydroxyacyl-CoA dehydratase family protein [Desulfarculaceae bacterium]|nr:2-hydroxyacyl-CoA dehydratase family protein [Desulfarculaceae bacterium]